MVNPRYELLPRSNKLSDQIYDQFWSEKKLRSKARSNRALEQKKKKNNVVLKKDSTLTIVKMKKRQTLT